MRLLILIICLFIFSATYAKEYVVTLKSTKRIEDAQLTANLAAEKLKITKEKCTIKEPWVTPWKYGVYIGIYEQKSGKYSVHAYFGRSKLEANYIKRLVKKVFPSARTRILRKSKKAGDDSAKKWLEECVSLFDTLYQVYSTIITGSDKNYFNAKRQAKELSRISGIPFSTRNHTYNKIYNGLLASRNGNQSYIPRRYGEYCNGYYIRASRLGFSKIKYRGCITVEESGHYGDKKGGYLIIVDIVSLEKEKEVINRMRKYTSKVYGIKSIFYTGAGSF